MCDLNLAVAAGTPVKLRSGWKKNSGILFGRTRAAAGDRGGQGVRVAVASAGGVAAGRLRARGSDLPGGVARQLRREGTCAASRLIAPVGANGINLYCLRRQTAVGFWKPLAPLGSPKSHTSDSRGRVLSQVFRGEFQDGRPDSGWSGRSRARQRPTC